MSEQPEVPQKPTPAPTAPSTPQPNQEVTPAVTREEIMAVFSQPAFYVNHFFAAPSADLIRLTFAEKTFDQSVKFPRCTVVCTHQGLTELSAMLASILQQLEQMKLAGQLPQVPPHPEKEALH